MPDTDLLAEAFDREPGMCWLCGARKRAWFAATIAMLTGARRYAMPDGLALVTPPDHASTRLGQLAWAARVAARCGPGAVRRTMSYVDAVEPHKPDRAWTLEFIGVRQAARGRGIAGELLRRVIADAPALCLTTADPANVPLYQRFGFHVDARLAVGPLDVHAMSRG